MLHARNDYNRIQDPAGKIPRDEPVFLLRAQDQTAAHVVDLWADCNQLAGGDPVAIQLAREQADRMRAWPIKHLADVPAGEGTCPEPIPNQNCGLRTGPSGGKLTLAEFLKWAEQLPPQARQAELTYDTFCGVVEHIRYDAEQKAISFDTR